MLIAVVAVVVNNGDDDEQAMGDGIRCWGSSSSLDWVRSPEAEQLSTGPKPARVPTPTIR